MAQQQGAQDDPEQSPAPEPPPRVLPPRLPNGPRRGLLDYSQAPMEQARRGLSGRVLRILRVLSVVLAVVLVLVVGFVADILLGGPGTAEFAVRDAGYSPRGRVGDWLDPGYADGYDSWTTDETVLGVSSDRAAVLVQRSAGASQDEGTAPLTGLDAATGAQRWQVTGLRCMGRDAVLDGSAYCARRNGGTGQIVGVDIATGQQRVVHESTDALSFLQVRGVHDGELIVTGAAGSDTEQVRAIGPDGALDWQLDLPWWGQCRFLVDHLGCVSYADSQVAVVDLSTGSFSLEPTEYEHSGQELSVGWAWNGFTTNDAGDERARRVRDLTGSEQGRITSSGGPDYGSDRLLYSREDLLAGGSRPTRIGVDATGRVVAVRSGSGIRTLPSRGRIDADSVDLVSADGSVLLARTYTRRGRAGDGDTWAVYAADGAKRQDLPRVTSSVDGLLVDETGGTTTVLVPRG